MKEEQWLLMSIIREREPGLMSFVDQIDTTPLSDTQREALREALADELIATGLDPEGRVNERGAKIDALIGRLAQS